MTIFKPQPLEYPHTNRHLAACKDELGAIESLDIMDGRWWSFNFPVTFFRLIATTFVCPELATKLRNDWRARDRDKAILKRKINRIQGEKEDAQSYFVSACNCAHDNPQLAYKEHTTAIYLAQKLEQEFAAAAVPDKYTDIFAERTLRDARAKAPKQQKAPDAGNP